MNLERSKRVEGRHGVNVFGRTLAIGQLVLKLKPI